MNQLIATILACSLPLLALSTCGASGFLFTPAAYPYGHRDGLDLLDDNPAAGENELGAGGAIGSFSVQRPDGIRYANGGAFSFGAEAFPSRYAGEPSELQARNRNLVLYPVTARFRAHFSGWSVAGDIRFEGGRLIDGADAWFFDNAASETYDRIRITVYEQLRIIRYRLAVSRELLPNLRLGGGMLFYAGSFEGGYFKGYDRIGPVAEDNLYFLDVEENLDGSAVGFQLGARYGQSEDEPQISAWISSGATISMDGDGRWRDESDMIDYRQTLDVNLPLRLEATGRWPLPWLGWGAHGGFTLDLWDADPVSRSNDALEIPEPSWNIAGALMAGASYFSPMNIEYDIGYRYLLSSGDDPDWEHSLRPTDQHRIDGQISYTNAGLTLRLYGGLSLNGDDLFSSPPFLEAAGAISYAAR